MRLTQSRALRSGLPLLGAALLPKSRSGTYCEIAGKLLTESIHVAGAKTLSLRSRESTHVISRSRESVLCESIHVAGAKTPQNMPIHDEIGLLAL